MSYQGDIRLGKTINFKFTTVNSAGAPTTLLGSPVVSAYPGSSTTQITAGITLSVDFDGITGLNNVAIVASSGNGYATTTDYQCIVTTGTVDGVSVVGYPAGAFSIENRSAVMPTVADRTLDVSSGGEAGVDWANVGSKTTSNALTGTTIATTQQVDVNTIKTNPVVNAGTVTFPTNSTLASTVNITAAIVTTTTNLTNAPTNGDFTATMKTSITTAATAATPTIASVSGSVGSVTGNVGGNVVGSVGSVVGAVGSVTGNVGGNVAGSVGSVTGAVGSVTGNVGGSVASVVGNLGGNVLGSVVGAVGSVTGNVGGNVVGTVASVVGAVGSVTGNVGGNVTGSIGSLAAQAKTDVGTEVATGLTATVADFIPAVGTRPSVRSGIYMLTSFFQEKAQADVTVTAYKADGTTPLMTFTVDDAVQPTAISRTS